MNMGMVVDVMDIIASGYSSSPSALERGIAAKVIDYFYRKGWMNAEEIAYLVEAAGGEIRIPENMITGPAPQLTRTLDPVTNEYVFRTGSKPDTTNAKVNPNAESRIVDSGEIQLRPAVEHRGN